MLLYILTLCFNQIKIVFETKAVLLYANDQKNSPVSNVAVKSPDPQSLLVL